LGITLMEVLISIGVVTVGLFGVLALIPLAGQQMNQGLLEDRKSAVGKNAFHHFKIRGMGNPTNWVTGVKDPNNATAGVGVYSASSAQAFCIDPLFAARHGDTNFPYMAGADPVMKRISLRRRPGGAPMSLIQAEEIFVAPDDLVFTAPTDKTLPPLQELSVDKGPDGQWGVAGVDDDGDGQIDNATEAGWPGSDDAAKRQSDGDLSWMATLVPKQGTNSDLYVLSIVVYYKRDLASEQGADGAWGKAGNDDDGDMVDDNVTEAGWAGSDDVANERLAKVKTFHGGGVGGGDVTLTSFYSSWPASAQAADLEVIRQGTWVMLAGNVAVGSPPNVVQVPIFKWYRIIAADAEVDTSKSPPEREVTLLGGDWNATATPISQPTGIPEPQVIIMKNVVAVYEKTLRLERNSLWMN
jgi:hypothetical protein